MVEAKKWFLLAQLVEKNSRDFVNHGSLLKLRRAGVEFSSAVLRTQLNAQPACAGMVGGVHDAGDLQGILARGWQFA